MINKSYTAYLTKEDSLHISCCDYLDLKYPNILYFHPLNESKRSYYERWYAKKMRMMPGVSDLIILEPRHGFNGLIIEFKIKPNKLTIHQNDFLIKCTKNNYKIAVIHEIDEFIKFITNYLKNGDYVNEHVNFNSIICKK